MWQDKRLGSTNPRNRLVSLLKSGVPLSDRNPFASKPMKIELDLERVPSLPPRTYGPPPIHSIPPRGQGLIASPEAGRVGSDTARIPVGAVYLLNALLLLISVALKPGGDRSAIAIVMVVVMFYLYIGVSLIRGSDFIEKCILTISYLRLGIHSVFLAVALLHPGKPVLSSAMALASSLGLIFLLSGKSLSKPTFIAIVVMMFITALF